MKRILIVEDDADNRDLIATILAFHGFETLRATNGRQAVEIARKERPDLILMDISMPIQNGFDAARQLKQEAGVADIPIVAMSAYDTREDMEAARAAGFVAFLIKPLDPFTLKTRLDEILAAGEG